IVIMQYDSTLAVYKEYLKNNNLFFTKERAYILESVLKQKDHFSVDDLLFDIQRKKVGKVSRATLYRNLSQLTEAGILNEADFGHGHIHYENLLVTIAHEHLICKMCSKVIEVDSEKLDKAIKTLGKEISFETTNYKVQIFGVCNECGNRYYSSNILHTVHEIATGVRIPEKTEQIPVAHAQ
ncbi:MAG: transcriptional repressor, partial [Desulfamplus sp.]|nr:transcriptional repressor [Desulfamplus sp.]